MYVYITFQLKLPIQISLKHGLINYIYVLLWRLSLNPRTIRELLVYKIFNPRLLSAQISRVVAVSRFG